MEKLGIINLQPALPPQINEEPGENPDELSLKELRKYLEEEKPPIDDKEDIGVDKDAFDYSVNSTFSDEDDHSPSFQGSPIKTPAAGSVASQPKREMYPVRQTTLLAPLTAELNVLQNRMEKNANSKKEEEQDISFEDISDVISNPYAEMPEFYPKQLDFEQVEGLPGAQRVQIEHKKKSVLKNKYWERVLKSVYDMATAEIPRPEHLAKVLSLYIINQEKLREKRKEQQSSSPSKQEETKQPKPPTFKNSRKTLPNAAALDLVKKVSAISSINNTLSKKSNKKETLPYAGSLTSVSKGTPSATPSGKFVHGMNLAVSHVASAEVYKRIEKIDKSSSKVNIGELAKETKNLLIRMPVYKRKEFDTFSSVDIDTTYPKMLTKYIFNQGFIQKWKDLK